MQKKKGLWLVLMVLLLVPSSYAEVLDTKVYGRNKILNYATKPDILTINITAAIGEQITADNVRIGAFDSADACFQRAQGVYLCTYSKETSPFNAGQQDFEISILNADGNTAATATVPVIIDVFNPELVAFSASSVNNNIEAHVSVADKACDACTSCVGVKNITVTESFQDSVLATRSNAFEPNRCAVTESFSFMSGTPQGFIGNVTVCASAIDHFNLATDTKCDQVFIDRQGPVITKVTLKDSNNEDIYYIGVPLNAVLKINFISDSLSMARADISPLNPSKGVESGYCSGERGNFTCFWNIQIFNPNISREGFINATDDLGNSIQEPIQYFIGTDQTPPQVLSFEFLRDGKVAKFYNRDTVVSIRLNITDENLRIDSVKVNVSDINYQDDFFLTSCDLLFNKTFSCSLDGITLKINETRSVKIPITASDFLNNVANVVATKRVVFDNTKPNIIFVGSLRVFRNQSFVGLMNNTLIMRAVDDTSGFSRGDVNLVFDGRNLRANECFETSRDWVCLWKNISFTTPGDIPVSTRNVFDDAGNKADDISSTLTVDTTPPALQTIKMLQEGLTADCPISGDTLIYEMNVTEQGPFLSLRVETFNVSTTPAFDGSCINSSSSSWICRVEIENIVPFHTNGSFTVILEDVAGNTQRTEHNVTICRSEVLENPNFVTVQLREPNTIPAFVDKKIASLTSHPIIVPMHFNITHNAHIARVDDDDCPLSLPFLDESYPVSLINQFSQDPMLSMRLRKGIDRLLTSAVEDNSTPIKVDPTANTLNLSCGLRLRLRIGTTVYSNPEVEQVNFTVQFSENSLGSLDAAINQKLAQIDQDIKDVQGQIDSKKSQLGTLKTICQTARMLGKINQIMQTIKSLLWNLWLIQFQAAKATPLTQWMLPIIDQIYTATCGIFNAFNDIVMKYIWPPGYLPNFEDPLANIGMFLFKYPCMIMYYCVSFNELLGNIILGAVDKYGLSRFSLNGGDTYIAKRENEKERRKLTGAYNPASAVTRMILRPGDSKLDPYKSIHMAGACVPAQTYNLMKEKQIKCLYRDCVRNHLGSGIPITACDIALKERECLYIEGAGAKGNGGLFSAVLSGFDDLERVAFLLVGLAYRTYCAEFVNAAPELCNEPGPSGWKIEGKGAAKSSMCGIVGTLITIKELIDTVSNGIGPGSPEYEYYFSLIEKEDFCSRS